MAKKKDTAYEDFLSDLKAINPQIEELLKDDKVSAKLKEGVLARADYSSKMDEMNSYLTEERKKIEGWQNWYGSATQEVATVQEQLRQYREEFGDLTPGQQRREAAKQGMSVEDFDKRLQDEIQKHDVAALKFMEDLTEIKIEHRENFKERLNTDDVYKLAGEKGLSLGQAYKEYIADKVEDKRKQDFATQIAAAKEEGAREALSKHNLPVVNSSSDMVHTLDVKDAPRTSDDRIAAAVSGFMNRGR